MPCQRYQQGQFTKKGWRSWKAAEVLEYERGMDGGYGNLAWARPGRNGTQVSTHKVHVCCEWNSKDASTIMEACRE